MVEDVIANAMGNLARIAPQSEADVRQCGQQIVGFGEEMKQKKNTLRGFSSVGSIVRRN